MEAELEPEAKPEGDNRIKLQDRDVVVELALLGRHTILKRRVATNRQAVRPVLLTRAAREIQRGGGCSTVGPADFKLHAEPMVPVRD